MEDERQADERETRRIEEAAASLAAQKAHDIAAKRQADAKARVVELDLLRKQVQYSTAEGSQLKAKLAALRKKQALSEISPPLAPTVEFPQTLSRSSHLWWAATVVAACAGVYLLVNSSSPTRENTEAIRRAHVSESAAHEVPPRLALAVATAPCTTEESEASVQPAEQAQPVPSSSNGKPKLDRRRPRGIPSRGGPAHRPKPMQSVVKDCIGTTDPLCGLENL